MTCVLGPATDAAADDPDDPAAAEALRARRVLDHIGWPGSPLGDPVVLDAGRRDLVRLAALAGLGAAAGEVDEAAGAAVHDGAEWHGDGPLAEMESIVGLLDRIGWTGGTPGSDPARDADDAIVGDALLIVSVEGEILSASPRFCALTGFTAEELVGARPPLPMWHPDDHAAFTAAVFARLRTGGRAEGVVRLRRKDGESLTVRMITYTVPGAGDAPALLVGIVADERELRATRRRLARADERFRELADGLPVPLWRTDHAGRITFANRAWTDFLGMSVPQPDPATLVDLIHPDDRTMVLTAWGAALAEQRGESLEFRVMRHDGDYRTVVLTSQPWFDDGVFLGFVGTSQDVTDRRRREAAREENRRMVRRMAERTPTCVWISDADGRMVFLNAAWLALAGRPVHSEIGDGWLGRLHPDDRERVREAIARAHRERTFLRVQARMRAGGTAGWREVLMLGEPRIDEERFEGMTGTLEDLTPLVEAFHMEEAIVRIARAAASDDGVDLLDVLADESARLVGFEVAAVLHADGDGLTVVAVHPDGGPWSVGQVLRAGEPEGGDAVATARARLRAGDVAGLLPDGLASGMLASVHVGGRLWGGLLVAGRGEGVDPAHHDRLARFAELAGLALAAGPEDPAAVTA